MPSLTYIPEGFPTITPFLIVRDAAKAIEFYKKAFGAVEQAKLLMPNGKVGYAEIRILNAPIMLADEFPDRDCLSPESLGGSPVMIYLYAPDVDAFVEKAVSEGATITQPVADQFFGERSGKIKDPFGHLWGIGTRTENLSHEEIKQRFEQLFQN